MQKGLYQKYLSEPDWLITENSTEPDFVSVNESQFTLGNGYIGSRGIYEEIPRGSQPGTFFAGIFDPTATKVSELVNAPNPFDLRIAIQKSEKLSIRTMEIDSHKRTLDMQHGLLARHTIFKAHNNKLYDYQSIRFISMKDLHTAVMRIALKPLNEATQFTVNSHIDTSVFNKGGPLEGDTRHFQITQIKQCGSIKFVMVKTYSHEISIAYAEQLFLHTSDGKRRVIKKLPFSLKLKKNETAYITKVVTFFTSKDVGTYKLETHTLSHLKKAVKKGFENLLQQHVDDFEKKWALVDMKLEGDIEAQTALRFNIYHLLIAAHPNVPNVSIGAKALTGEGYRGHVFWETEILMLPFYAYFYPRVARSLLTYRYQRMDVAKEIAAQRGYKGAMFPWESAETGLDETPAWGKNLEGEIRLIHTGKQEHHIVADVCYGVCVYFKVTRDVDFMLAMGLEILIETARFWKSRLTYNKSSDLYEIRHIIGPDEFHERVNNNAYTNALAAYNLKSAAYFIEHFYKEYPKELQALLKKLKFTTKESKQWRSIAKKIKMPIKKSTKIIEQFDGYFKLKKYRLPALNDYGIPKLPEHIEETCLYQTQFVKQADVIMLFHLLPEQFDDDVAKRNYHFYEKRTLHKSSLSAGPHSVVAARLGFAERACHYFNICANSDRKNIYGNTHEGIHAATLGGTWQAIMYGFCGIRVIYNCLRIAPNLPTSWRCMKLAFCYQGNLIHVKITPKTISIIIKRAPHLRWLTSQKHFKLSREIAIYVYSNLYHLKLNKEYIFEVPKEKYHPYQEMEGLL